jgi:multicomponent Na+:H+ antiporter subunit F
VIDLATDVALAALGLAMVMVLIRVIRGPTVADRILGLDVLSLFGAAIIGVFAVRSGYYLLADVAVVAVVIAFVSTAAFARYLLSRGAR